MSQHASDELAAVTGWDGKALPFGMSYGKFMMWVFLFSDALTFGGFLASLGFIRHQYQHSWPIGEETFFKLPFLSGDYPLGYVAFMTFLLILSSVTMVLAVEAGHRMDRKGVVTWLFWTIIGGLTFVGSQAWEWSHFIHGTPFGGVELSDGSHAIVKGDFGEIQNFEIIQAGTFYSTVGQIVDDSHISKVDKDLMHAFQHAAASRKLSGTTGDLKIVLHDGSIARVNKAADKNIRLIIKEPGAKFATSIAANEDSWIGEDQGSVDLYYEALTNGRVTYGANLQENEYGPQTYSHFFFFVTGFHGFHVSIGIAINIVVFINVLKGTYERRGHYEMVEKGGLYWHFVDLVWVFVFTFMYLI